MSLEHLPEVFVSDKTLTKSLYRYLKNGTIKKIGPKLYTKNLNDDSEYLVKKHLWMIVSSYFPDGLITDRTAIEGQPSRDNVIYLISKKTREIKIPGFVIKPHKGPPFLSTDHPFIGGLKICSMARAFLENMESSRIRKKQAISRTLSRDEIEERLEKLIRHSGEKGLNQLRDEVNTVANELNRQDLYKKFDLIVGSFFGTKEGKLKSSVLIMRKQGMPFDPQRIDLFQNLYAALKNMSPISRLRLQPPKEECLNLAFFEAYFSNFIEGTEFDVNEAKEIIFQQKIIKERPADSHDIMGTFKVVSSLNEMTKPIKNFESFISVLTHRHTIIMGGRNEVKPGMFKEKMNRAGDTFFVEPGLVVGTLNKGYELLASIECPLYRAIFMMFLIAEIHPFNDGNGRIARIMMNAELVKAGEYPIIIPTVYRNNYLTSLKAFSHNKSAEPLIRVLDFSQKYTASVDWSTYQKAQQYLEESNAFIDPQRADLEGIRLKIVTR